MRDPDLPDPFALVGRGPWKPAARREATVHGAPVELVLLPQRRARGGVPGSGRAAFRGPIAERILREEAVWSAPGVVLTPNRFPFAAHHALLWADLPTREPTTELLETAIRLAAPRGGTVLGNSIGASASIQRAHLHLVPEQMPFLTALPSSRLELGGDLLAEGVELVRPGSLDAVGVRGELRTRVAAALRLVELRMTPAFNLIDDGATTWMFPRVLEIPAPHYPTALGAAELWGRWVYGDEGPFEAATGQALERALEAALCRV